MKKMDLLINLNDYSKFSTLPHVRIILAHTPILSNEVSTEPVTYHQQIHKEKNGTHHKIFLLPSKGSPEADHGRDSNAVGKVFTTKPLRPFFNITFYIKWIYRCIKINFTRFKFMRTKSVQKQRIRNWVI